MDVKPTALKQLDLRGEICPYPMIKTAEALKQLKPEDERLEVIIDHPPALQTIPTQAARLGFFMQVEEFGSSEWRLILTRSR